MPAMIEKAGNPALKEALQQHLQITEEQRTRLEQVQQLMAEGEEQNEETAPEGGERKRGFIAGLFRRNAEEKQVCLGTKGLIEEGQKVMNENMEPEVLDAAIIGCAQKIEHYEICGYGTAKAYARELGLEQVERLLEQTLNEEYEADDRLTDLAVGRLNREAEEATGSNRRGASKRGGASGNRGSAAFKGRSGGTKSGARNGGSNNKSAFKTATKKGASKGGSKAAGKAAGKSKAAAKGGAKTASKGGGRSTAKSSSKGAAKKGSAGRRR
jgi:ferritin-like metal-binding protein YciE